MTLKEQLRSQHRQSAKKLLLEYKTLFLVQHLLAPSVWWIGRPVASITQEAATSIGTVCLMGFPAAPVEVFALKVKGQFGTILQLAFSTIISSCIKYVQYIFI